MNHSLSQQLVNAENELLRLQNKREKLQRENGSQREINRLHKLEMDLINEIQSLEDALHIKPMNHRQSLQWDRI